MKVKIKDIKIKNRIRNELGDLTSLQESVMKVGLLHPILINEKYELISGLRRLYACRNIGWTEIEAQIVKTDDELVKLEIEAHENLIRKDFTHDEIEVIIKRRKELMKKGIFQKIIGALKKFFKWIASLFKRNKKMISKQNIDDIQKSNEENIIQNNNINERHI